MNYLILAILSVLVFKFFPKGNAFHEGLQLPGFWIKMWNFVVVLKSKFEITFKTPLISSGIIS